MRMAALSWASILLIFVGLAIGISSHITWSRRWPGMIAGFDPHRCTDINELTRRVGLAGISLGVVCLFAGVVALLVPGAIGIVLGLVAVAGMTTLGVTVTTCSRFTRR